MGVYGRTRRTVVGERPWQPVDHDVPVIVDSASRCQPILEDDMKLQQYERVPSRYWRHDVGSCARAGRLKAFDRIGRLEYEGARHHREGEVKSDVDEDCAQHRALHAGDSNLTANGAPAAPILTRFAIRSVLCPEQAAASPRNSTTSRPRCHSCCQTTLLRAQHLSGRMGGRWVGTVAV